MNNTYCSPMYCIIILLFLIILYVSRIILTRYKLHISNVCANLYLSCYFVLTNIYVKDFIFFSPSFLIYLYLVLFNLVLVYL